MAHWDRVNQKVVGNNDVRFCCVKIKSSHQVNTEETEKIKEAIKKVNATVDERAGGFWGFVGTIAGGVTQRATGSAKKAATEVIYEKVPGVTARVVSKLQCTIPIGIAIMSLSGYLANTQELENDNQNYYYLGILFGAYFSYSPVPNEQEEIAKKAESAAESAGAIMPNLCSIQ